MSLPRLSTLFSVLTRRRHVPAFEWLSAHICGLRPGDKLILGFLGALIVASSLIALFALERSVLVRVPAHGGTLTEGIIGSPRFVNPLLALSDADRDLTALTYAGLMKVDGDGMLQLVLAESYSVSEDGKEYVFVIREDARFSDGTPVTADDVVFTIERAQDPALKSPELANWASIKADVVDARTVRFLLPKPYAPFLIDTTLGILPAHLWRNIPADEFPFSPLMTKPVGAGPFQIANVARGSDGSIKEIELKPFAKYVLGKPYLDRIRVKFFDDLQALQSAYKSGSIESAHGIASDTALRAPYSRVFGAFFNSDQNPAFARREVREALSLAVDRTRIVNDILGGYATALMGPVPPGSSVTQPALPEGNSVELAKAALTDGGWAQDPETGLWSNAKEKITLPSITLKTSNVPELKAIAAEIESDWEALGVPVEVELYEPGDLASDVIRPRAYEALLFGMVIGRDQDLYAFWDSGERQDPGLNIAAYANKTVDGLLDDARTELDPEAKQAALQRISDAIALDFPAAFTHAPDFLYAVPKSVYGVRLPQITSPSDRFNDVSTWYRESEYVWPFLVPASE
ncbi:MAG: peptide/nickel transport system substrate-binding protein [Parcubacteria bacterium C7867-004]|nr:MAG: peptide/nickel transport system substrate-binding protein [Parcubacteria bacterium C7867-004]